MGGYLFDISKVVTPENYYLKIAKIAPEVENDKEWQLPCIFHKEKHGRSLSIDRTSGAWICFGKCGEGGGIIKFHARLKGTSEDEAVRELKVLLGVTKTIPADKVKECHERLLKTPHVLEFLTNKRGWSQEVINRFLIGFDGERIWIPVKVDGDYVNVRKYRWLHGGESTDKMTSYSDGSKYKYGDARLFPDENLHNDLPVLLCEGETDCLLAITLGYNAVTATGGAGTWKSEFTQALAGKTVYVCYDIDDAGKKGEDMVASAIGRACKEVRVIHLPITEPKTGDFTDYIVAHGYSKKDFDELIEKTEPYKPRGRVDFELDPHVNSVTLVESSLDKYYLKTIEMPVIVSGKDLAPFMIPRVVKFTCTQSRGKACFPCGLGPHGYQGELKLEVKHPVEILEFTGVPKSVQDIALEAKVDLVKCPLPVMEIIEQQNVERVRVIPEINYAASDMEYVSRDIYVLGQGIKANTSYTMKGVTVPDPKRQYATQVIYHAEPNQLGIDQFKMSPDIKERLSVFKVKEGETMRQRLDAIYADLTVNVTQIYKREDVQRVIDLTYHSVLQFKFLGRLVEKGWVEALIIGDTRCGKSNTVKPMIAHYRTGEFITCENTSYAGLIGGIQEVQDRRFISWGKIPLNDRRLVVLDEVSSLKDEILSEMSAVRSSGVAEINKIMAERTPARTRLIWLSNTRTGRTLASYNHGVASIRELIGKLEDVARFDIAVTVASGEVSDDVAFEMRGKKVEHVYTSDLCNLLVMWAWSRTPDQVKIGTDTEEAIRKAVQVLAGKYSSEIPLVEPSEQRIKLARLSVALACRLFSTSNGEDVVVTPGHVAEVLRFMQECYDKPSMGYDAFSRSVKKTNNLSDKDTAKIKKEFKDFRDWATLRDILLESDVFKRNELVDQTGYDLDQARDLFRWLGKWKLIKAVPWGYTKHPIFTEVLKSMAEEKEGPPPPTAY